MFLTFYLNSYIIEIINNNNNIVDVKCEYVYNIEREAIYSNQR